MVIFERMQMTLDRICVEVNYFSIIRSSQFVPPTGKDLIQGIMRK